MTAEHTARRPEWVCRDCGQPWPCAERRRLLVVEYAGMSATLVLFLAGMFAAASAERPEVPADEMYDRFVGWVRAEMRHG